MRKKITMKAYERSSADKRADKAAARHKGVSIEAYEGSKADMKADRAAVKKMNKGRK